MNVQKLNWRMYRSWLEWKLAEETEVLSKNPLQSHFLNHKFQAGNHLSELSHGPFL
jgi:hypothetical protein